VDLYRRVSPHELTCQAESIPGAANGSTAADTLAHFVLPLLDQSAVLPKLKALQSSLDATDISDLAARFAREHPNVPVFEASVLHDIEADELDAFAAKYVQQVSEPNGVDAQGWTLRERIVAYSLSAIFKDCSIIIRAVLAPITGTGTHAEAGEEAAGEGEWTAQPSSSVKLLDLDLKPLKMRHWYELDDKLWKHWRDTRDERQREERSVGAPLDSVTTLDVVAGSVQVRDGDADGDATVAETPFGTPKPKFFGKLNLADNASVRAVFAPSPTPSGHVDGARASVDTTRESAGAGEADAQAPAVGPVPPTPGVEMSLEDALSLPPAPGAVLAGSTSAGAGASQSTAGMQEVVSPSAGAGAGEVELDTTPLQSPAAIASTTQVPAAGAGEIGERMIIPASPLDLPGDDEQGGEGRVPDAAAVETEVDEATEGKNQPPAKASSFIERPGEGIAGSTEPGSGGVAGLELVSTASAATDNANADADADADADARTHALPSDSAQLSPVEATIARHMRSGAPSPVPFDDAQKIHGDSAAAVAVETHAADEGSEMVESGRSAAPAAKHASDIVPAPPSPTFGTGTVAVADAEVLGAPDGVVDAAADASTSTQAAAHGSSPSAATAISATEGSDAVVAYDAAAEGSVPGDRDGEGEGQRRAATGNVDGAHTTTAV
jgi:hypothetical protein